MKFLKMHAIGNDFMILDMRSKRKKRIPSLQKHEIARLAEHYTGVGFDQMVEIRRGDEGIDAEVRFHNSDGSKAGACGNGLRCVAAHLLEETDADSVVIRTDSGVSVCKMQSSGWVDVEMGRPKLKWKKIPLSKKCDTKEFSAPPSMSEAVDTVSAVGMGNPHVLVFTDDLKTDTHPWGLVVDLGIAAQKDPLFPDGVNLSIVEIKDTDRIRLYVWERGSGLTRSCGSAACAAVVAAVRRGLVNRMVTVEFSYGSLRVMWPESDAPLRLAGPVSRVYRGKLDRSFFDVGEHLDDFMYDY